MNDPLRLGTRGSKLALIQAEKVRAALELRFPELKVEVDAIKTRGDRLLDSPLSKIGGKGLFIREIEEALMDGRIDLAVHSLKDLPTLLPPELMLGGVLPREDPRDALVSRNGCGLAELKPGQRVGTSSLRRRAQLLKVNPDLQVVDIRGNVDTRLDKLKQGQCDALVLAACGLQRTGSASAITEYLEPQVMLPAVCQGIIGVEIRRQDKRTTELVAAVSDPSTLQIAESERIFLHRLEGGCEVPIGCLATIHSGECTVTGLIASLDGEPTVRSTVCGKALDLRRLAAKLADDILEQGGAEILASIRNNPGR